MICSIHQPNFIPYIGLFDKINNSDIFILYDNAQYTKGDYHNRNSIKGSNGKILLSIPVSVKLGQKINEIHFDNRVLLKFWKTIEQSYKKSPFFEKYYKDIKEIFDFNETNLADFNIFGIKKICSLLALEVKFTKASDICEEIPYKSTDALIYLCQKTGSDEYISGSGGKGYIDEKLFRDNNVKLSYQNFTHPTYKQNGDDFIPYLSIIDYLFNEDGGYLNKNHISYKL